MGFRVENVGLHAIATQAFKSGYWLFVRNGGSLKVQPVELVGFASDLWVTFHNTEVLIVVDMITKEKINN